MFASLDWGASFFRRLANSQIITPAAARSNTPRTTPTPKPTFAPVESPLLSLLVGEGVLLVESLVDVPPAVVPVLVLVEEVLVEDAGLELITPSLLRKTPWPCVQHVSPLSPVSTL